MGFDTYVVVGGRTLIDYRKQAGDLPRFLFDRINAVVVGGDENNPPEKVSFETTASGSLAVLDAQGFGWGACVAAYNTIRSGWGTEAMLLGMYMVEEHTADPEAGLAGAEPRAEERVARQSTSSPENDLIALGQLLAEAWLDQKTDEPLFLHHFFWGEYPELSSSLFSQVVDAAQKAGVDPLPPTRAAETLAGLFQEARLIAWPILMAVFLNQLPPDTSVAYELSEAILEFDMEDIPSTEAYLDTYWNVTGKAIVDYARNLGVLFGVLAEFEGGLGAQYWFGEAITALNHLEALNADRSASSNKERGDALERLMEALFNTEGPALTVAEKNFSTREEEIDLVLRSNLPAPYWAALNSSYWFVECKNWARPVGVQEIRVFESKMDDRKSTVRVGLIVSTNGFYRTAIERLKQAQAKDIGLIYALTLDDLRDLIGRRRRISDWLLNEGSMRAFGSGLIGVPD